MIPANAPPDAWPLENDDLLPETSVPPDAMECANLPTMAMVKSRPIICHITIYCPRNHQLPSTDYSLTAISQPSTAKGIAIGLTALNGGGL